MIEVSTFCPESGVHEYRTQQGYFLCARHGRWLAKLSTKDNYARR